MHHVTGPFWKLTGLALAALLGLTCLLRPNAFPQPATPVASPIPPPKAYTRVAHPSSNTVELQVAMRLFRPTAPPGPDLWLVAVTHVGETNYFERLQSFLDLQDLVLFEGVGDPQTLKTRSRSRSHNLGRPKPAQEDALPDSEQDLDSLQQTLATSLDLAFQLDAIQYDRRHFQNSDLSLEQLQAILLRQIKDSTQTSTNTSPSPNAAFLMLLAAMDGSSWLGAVLHMTVKLLGSSPKLKAMTRLLFIEILGQLKGDLAQVQGLPPEMQELLQVLIRERNKTVVADLKTALRRPKSHTSIAVLYGAGHMDDLEKRLASELQYHPAEDRWLPAITVQPAQAGLTPAEIELVRNLIRWQMKQLQPASPPP